MFTVKTVKAKTFKTGTWVYNVNFGGTFEVVSQTGNKVTLRNVYTGEVYAPVLCTVIKAFGPKALARLQSA